MLQIHLTINTEGDLICLENADIKPSSFLICKVATLWEMTIWRLNREGDSLILALSDRYGRENQFGNALERT